MIYIPKFKIRCSAIGKIMAKSKTSGGLTDNQKIELEKLQTKEKLTEKQGIKLTELIAKRDAPPEISEGAKTYCKEWLRSIIFNRDKEIDSKYLDKGNLVEDQSIEFLKRVYLLDDSLCKNEKFFQDEYLQGTPDLIPDKNYVWDMKNSWSVDSFPYLENEIPSSLYYYQLQGYMSLTGRTKAKLIYCLMNTPDHLIEREIKIASYNTDKSEEDLRSHFYSIMRFDDIPSELRFREFSFDINEKVLFDVRDKVILCRKYIDELVKEMNEKRNIKIEVAA